MTESDWLAERFEEYRRRLRGVAYRMLGSLNEADDAVQEAWIRLSRSNAGGIENLGGWLTTVVARVCLDMLRSRTSRREESFDAPAPQPSAKSSEGIDPEQEALLADSVGLALLVVLDRLTPAERLAFVLHDMFGVSFDEIAPIVGRSATAARQLASRARRRVQGGATVPGADLSQQRKIIDAFLAALRGGDLEALVELLDPDFTVRADEAALPPGAIQANPRRERVGEAGAQLLSWRKVRASGVGEWSGRSRCRASRTAVPGAEFHDYRRKNRPHRRDCGLRASARA